MNEAFRLSRRQWAALAILVIAGVVVGLVAARGKSLPVEMAPWTARVSFMDSNRAALYVAPALPVSDVEARFRQTALDPAAPWNVFRAKAGWTDAREAVIARYVDLPNSVPVVEPEGPVVKLRRHTRHFRVWP
ncbi:MAG TPA: hypothetical protein VL860_02200 [Planctomycetota bacterium]|nr:hypothetical protein [Planctomycetota bacterium]